MFFLLNTGVQFQKKHMENVPAKLTTEEAKFSVGFTVMALRLDALSSGARSICPCWMHGISKHII